MVESWSRWVGLAVGALLIAVYLWGNATGTTIANEALAFLVYLAMVLGIPFFLGMAIRHWLLAIVGGFLTMYVLSWSGHLIQQGGPTEYGVLVGSLIALAQPIAWAAMVFAWLGTRAPRLLNRLLEHRAA